MGISFSKIPKISSKDKAILELKVQRDKLKQYEKKIQVVIARELQVAKQQLALKNHHASRLALTKKKYQESLLEKTGNQLMTIENLCGTIEYALVEQEIISKLELGNTVLKQIHKEMDLEKVEQIMDDTADGIAYQKEIEEVMARELSPEDQDEIMAELDKLIENEVLLHVSDVQAREKVKDMPALPQTIVDLKSEKVLQDLPSVPKTEPKKETRELLPA